MGRTNSTTSLIDERAIVTTIITRMKRWNNIVTTMPTFNAYGEVCCCICNGTPVTDAIALVNNKNKSKSEGEVDNISFITFICGKHARDPEIYNITHDSGVFRRLLEFRKEVR